MPTEIQIRNAIASTIKSVAPTAVVIARNALDLKDNGWLMLFSPDGENIHGWMVTQRAALINEQRANGKEYSLSFNVWQFFDYTTGNDISNSEDVASAERESVMLALANTATLPSELSRCDGLEFSLIDLFWVGDRLVHIAQGSVTVSWLTACA